MRMGSMFVQIRLRRGQFDELASAGADAKSDPTGIVRREGAGYATPKPLRLWD